MQRLAEQVLIIFPAVNNGGGSSREYNDLHGPRETLLERGLPYDNEGRNTIRYPVLAPVNAPQIWTSNEKCL